MYAVWAFLIAAAFWPGIEGAATSPRWSLVALGLYWLPVLSLPYLAVCFWRLDFDQACHWAFVAAAVGFGARTPRSGCAAVVLAFCAGVGLSSALAPFQFLGWQGVPQVAPPAGLFLNKNLMGEAAALGLLAASEFFSLRSKEFVICEILTLPAIVLSNSRAVMLALVVASAFRLPWRYFLALISAGSLIACILIFRGSSDLSAASLMQRFSLWHDALTQLTWLGNGSYDYTTVEHREPNLHNDWLQFVFELGVVGAIPIGLVAFVRNRAPTFIAGLVVVASFGFPLHVPATAWLAAVIVGHCLRMPDDDGRTATRLWGRTPVLRSA